MYTVKSAIQEFVVSRQW